MNDGADFNDPAAWGYCEECAFEVAVSLETGRILTHQRRTGDWDVKPCKGEGRKPKERPTEAFPPVRGSAKIRVEM